MHEKHLCVSATSSKHFPLKIGHNCYSSRIALPSHHFCNQTAFPALTGVLSPLSPKSVYPFPYHSHPRRWVVPYLCSKEWAGVSTGDPSPDPGCCPVPPPTSLSSHQPGISLPSQSHSPCRVFWDEWRSILVLGYSKHCQRRPRTIQTSCSSQRTLARTQT